ncbi:MAG: class F sortase [Patescibacteria group bacterium]|nr:class F sortase [Patescibacteria group bacterium]
MSEWTRNSAGTADIQGRLRKRQPATRYDVVQRRVRSTMTMEMVVPVRPSRPPAFRQDIVPTQPAKPVSPVISQQQPVAVVTPSQYVLLPSAQFSEAVPNFRHHNVARKKPSKWSRLSFRKYSLPQLALASLAFCSLTIGLGVSLQTWQTNKSASAQVAALSKKNDAAPSGTSDNPLPSTTKPSPRAVASYAVAPDLPRYISIPKLGVKARVLQAGVKTDGELATPSNVYDTAWYTGSAKPGQAGATLIDGHVSSWKTNGVFYGLRKLQPNDTIQITRGDGAVLNYRVVKTQLFDAAQTDMQAAITPVTAGKSGLNLITCSGKVKPGTNEFTQRLIVFTEQL